MFIHTEIDMSESNSVWCKRPAGRLDAQALLSAGWPVRALVRDLTSAKARALREAGAELVQASFTDTAALRSAMRGAHGVFCVQQSSPSGQVMDEEEERFGIAIADLAVDSRIKHLVYSSGAAVSGKPTWEHCGR